MNPSVHFANLLFYLVYLAVALGFTNVSIAMDLNDLDTSRRTDWTQAGYPGGIPSVNENIVVVTDHGVTGDGTTDDHDVIQTLIDNSDSPAVLLFHAGRYRIESPLILKAGIVLRGEGSETTHLDFFSDAGCMIIRGSTSGAFVPIQNGFQKGSTQITVSDASGFQTEKER